jgi:hypothetical protein
MGKDDDRKDHEKSPCYKRNPTLPPSTFESQQQQYEADHRDRDYDIKDR